MKKASLLKMEFQRDKAMTSAHLLSPRPHLQTRVTATRTSSSFYIWTVTAIICYDYEPEDDEAHGHDIMAETFRRVSFLAVDFESFIGREQIQYYLRLEERRRPTGGMVHAVYGICDGENTSRYHSQVQTTLLYHGEDYTHMRTAIKKTIRNNLRVDSREKPIKAWTKAFSNLENMSCFEIASLSILSH